MWYKCNINHYKIFIKDLQFEATRMQYYNNIPNTECWHSSPWTHETECLLKLWNNQEENCLQEILNIFLLLNNISCTNHLHHLPQNPWTITKENSQNCEVFPCSHSYQYLNTQGQVVAKQQNHIQLRKILKQWNDPYFSLSEL